MSFSPFQPEFFDRLKGGGPDDAGAVLSGDDWFREAIFHTFSDIATKHGCTIQLSKRRIREARELWLNEIQNMKISGGGEPDHFKQAGFLVYWLRRRIVISIVREGTGFVGTARQRVFLERPNETCAFLLGFRICLYFVASKRAGPEREEYLSSIALDEAFVNEASILLFEKQLSPHAMYLIYRSLFYDLKLRGGPDVVTNLRLVSKG
ncbi:hypothetical protein [Bradyrhizobium sp. UNPF46]|uniref:hypothetical protein n=1 Tax=Bradyrhizobium sp. UNPF46 TaxID=1141168 RepID=UPI001150F715|nr:hypothetical protein [Bradyrhizobium sp. UNPF46]